MFKCYAKKLKLSVINDINAGLVVVSFTYDNGIIYTHTT